MRKPARSGPLRVPHEAGKIVAVNVFPDQGDELPPGEPAGQSLHCSEA